MKNEIGGLLQMKIGVTEISPRAVQQAAERKFKGANGKNAICCRVLTKEFNMGQGEHKEQRVASGCLRFCFI